jgi:4-hydroxybenzoate polyprenyltransferase
VSRGTPEPVGPHVIERLRGACRRAIWADQFVRTGYLGLTEIHLLLGVASTGAALSAPRLAALAFLAACFHVHIFLLNDVIDLEVDATQPRRANHPLVRGLRGEGVSRERALVITWLAAALAVATAWWIGANQNAWLSLAAGFVLIDVYNVWGKRFPVPPVTDAIQALGWWGLVLFGVFAASPSESLAQISDRALPLLALSFGFTVLVTGVHGGLRDLVNDLAHGRTNTAIFLGARPDTSSPDATAVQSSWAVVGFAFAVLALMFWPSLGFVAEPAHFASAGWQRAAAIVMALIFVANVFLVWRVVKPVEAQRDAWVSADLFGLLLPAPLLYFLSALPPTSLKWLAGLLFAVPLAFQTRFMKSLLAWLDRFGTPLATVRTAAAGHAVEGED